MVSGYPTAFLPVITSISAVAFSSNLDLFNDGDAATCA